ncbi:MAG TPA: type I-E CRISPR-associated protein Cse1/CasA, partial [Trueperaceae bacterium]
MSSFSLWTEPWIPVQRLDGASERVSLPAAVAEAHTIRGIADSSPLITVALHRLLLALVYRTHQLVDIAHWERIWQAGRFDDAAVFAYGERWADRFDLLHPSRPFYQVPFMADERVHPVAALVLEAASGNNPALFDHGRVEGATELPLDRAACYLLAHQAFAIRGGDSKPFNRMDAPLTKGFIVEVMGSNLFETLALNVMTREHWERITPDLGADKPFWEEDTPPDPVKEGTPVKGPLHYLTWQSRRVHLVVDAARQLVTGCQIAQRYCLPKDGTPVDPGKCYYRDTKKEQGWQPRRLREDRAAWRLTHVLLQSTTPNPKD